MMQKVHFRLTSVAQKRCCLRSLVLQQGRQPQRQKAIRLVSKTTTLTCTTFFCTFLRRLCTTTTWNDQILSLIEDENGKAINSTISVWTRALPPLFSSNLNPLLSSNRTTSENREMVRSHSPPLWGIIACYSRFSLSGKSVFYMVKMVVTLSKRDVMSV